MNGAVVFLLCVALFDMVIAYVYLVSKQTDTAIFYAIMMIGMILLATLVAHK